MARLHTAVAALAAVLLASFLALQLSLTFFDSGSQLHFQPPPINESHASGGGNYLLGVGKADITG